MKYLKYIRRISGIGVLLLLAVVLIILWRMDTELDTDRDTSVYDFNEGWVMQTVDVSDQMQIPDSQSGGTLPDSEDRDAGASQVPEGVSGQSQPDTRDPESESQGTQDSESAGNPEQKPDSPGSFGRGGARGRQKSGVSAITQALETAEKISVTLPYAGTSEGGKTVVFSNTLPDEYAGLTLVFYSTNASVRVVVGDDNVVYRYGMQEKYRLGRSPGSNENFVDLPTRLQGNSIRIELTSHNNNNAAATLGAVSVSQRDVALLNMIQNSSINVVSCILIVLFAVFLIFITFLRKYTKLPGRGDFFLGMLGLDLAFYFFMETRTLGVIYGSGTEFSVAAQVCLLFLPLFLSLFFERNLGVRFPRTFGVVMTVVYLSIVGQFVLQVGSVLDFGDMQWNNYALLLLVIGIAIFTLIRGRKGERAPRLPFKVVSLLFLISTMTALYVSNMAVFESPLHKGSQLGIAIVYLMMTADQIIQLVQEYKERGEESEKRLREELETIEKQNELLTQAKAEAEEARKEAIAANEAKGKFLARMSHEIRTPINAVLGMDEMILRESHEPDIREYAMDIYTAGQTLLSLINDILDFSKIESGKMEIVPVDYDLSSLIHDLVNMISLRAQNKNLEFEVEVDENLPARLYGDDVRIRQVLTNILTNAVKYTHEGTVWFRVSGVKNGREFYLHFEVEDTGIGIREEDLPKLYAEFERIEENRNRNIEGTGLGMNITIQMLALMGSRLKVESEYGKGSRFYFDLMQSVTDETPLGDLSTRVQHLADNYTYASHFCAPDARVLVVDDNMVNRKVFMSLLKQTQIHVEQAGSGKECLERIQKQHYDLIFLDHMMPEMDGVETLHRMREMESHLCRDTPVIVLTANAVTGARENYLKEGFDDFLSKPIVSEKLEAMLWDRLPKEMIRQCEEEPGGLPEAAAPVPESMPEDLPDVDGLDWNYAWLHLPERELLEYTVQEFYGQIASAADRLEEMYVKVMAGETEETGGQNPPLTAYRIQVHAMKSLAATIGIIPLAGMAKILEYAAREGYLAVLRQMTEIFLAEWRSYLEKLDGVCGIQAAGQKLEVTDVSIIVAYLDMLRLSMEEMDIDRADEMVRELAKYQYSEKGESILRALEEAVMNLDIEECGRLVDEMMGEAAKE